MDYNSTEIYRNYLTKFYYASAIKLFVDKNIESFEGLFKDIEIVKEIYFFKFYRKDNTNMNTMFISCKNLIIYNIYKIRKQMINFEEVIFI